jgi:hypothetical protein
MTHNRNLDIQDSERLRDSSHKMCNLINDRENQMRGGRWGVCLTLPIEIGDAIDIQTDLNLCLLFLFLLFQFLHRALRNSQRP